MVEQPSAGPVADLVPRRVAAVMAGRRAEWIELMSVVLVVSVLVGAALGYYEVATVKAMLSEASDVTVVVRHEIAGFHAREGRWPDSIDLAPTKVGTFIASIEVEGGAVTTTFAPRSRSLAGRRLTLRPVVVPGHPDVPLRWTCGPQPVAAPAAAVGIDRTDVPPEFLTHLCRDGANR